MREVFVILILIIAMASGLTTCQRNNVHNQKMLLENKIGVTPIYGWGWNSSNNQSIAVPEPFKASKDRLSEEIWVGYITSLGHEYEGDKILLSQRHDEWDHHVNIEIRLSDGIIVTGFATVD